MLKGKECDTAQLLLFRPSDSGQFQELPEGILSCLPSYLRSLPEGGNVSIAEKTVTQHTMLFD